MDESNGTDNRKITFTVEIIVEPDEGHFYAYCPALKGLHVAGDTEEEAINNAVATATAYIRSLIKHGEPIPVAAVSEPGESTHIGAHAHPQTLALSLT